MLKNIVLVLSLILLIVACKGQNTMVDKTVVKDFEIERYLGKWYELARYDHVFERGLVGVSAVYSWRDDGKIKVFNSGFQGSLTGAKSEITGKAKIPNPKVPAKLKVSFFGPFYGDYFVLELDKDYQWAVVGSNSDDYLWILSRTPQMEADLYQEILAKLTKRGYNTSKLIEVLQETKTGI